MRSRRDDRFSFYIHQTYAFFAMCVSQHFNSELFLDYHISMYVFVSQFIRFIFTAVFPHHICFHVHSKVDIDDISFTLNLFFNHLFLLSRRKRTLFLLMNDTYDFKNATTACSSSPCSYRQPSGNRQSLSRRYCTHSGCVFLDFNSELFLAPYLYVCICLSLLERPNSSTALWRFRV